MLIDQLTTVAPEDEPKIAVYTTKFISAANAVADSATGGAARHLDSRRRRSAAA
jgi:hypothetical protein